MGWNEGYTIMERTVVTLYDAGVLTAPLLDQIMEPYKHTDCDPGGSEDLIAQDGRDVTEIICAIMEPEAYQDVIAHPEYWDDVPPNWKNNERASDLFDRICRDRWGIY